MWAEKNITQLFAKSFIDELAGTVVINDYKSWSESVYNNTGIEWGDTLGDVTGKVLYNHNDEGSNSRSCEVSYNVYWVLKLIKSLNKETGEFTIMLKVNGCPSKIFYCGNNYRNIPLVEFKKIVVDFAEKFCLKLEDIKPAGSIEASITIEPDYDELVLNHSSIRGRILSGKKDKYGEDSFIETKNGSNDFMGYKYKHGHMTKKIYLPAVKFKEHLNSIRIEERFDKIQGLLERSGCIIESWEDLLTAEAHYKLYQIVLQSWESTIIIDRSLRRNRNNPDWLNDMINKGKHSSFWLNDFFASASDKTLKERMITYRKLCFEKGDGLHTRVRLMIESEGQRLRDPSTWMNGRYSDIGYIKSDSIEDCNKNNIMQIVGDVRNHDSSNSGKKQSRKQLIREKERLKEIQRNRFMDALKVTLIRLAA